MDTDNDIVTVPPEIYKLSLKNIADFFLFLQTNNYSPKTVYNYKQDLLVFNYFMMSHNITIPEMTKRHAFEFKAFLASDERKTPQGQGDTKLRLSPASTNRCLSAVRAYIKFLIDQDIRLLVVPDHFKMVKRDRIHPHVAEINELISLIESPSLLEEDPVISSRNRAILEVLFATGMRISELTSLNKRDLNDSGRVLITGKGRKQRFVYLTERAQKFIDEYLALRDDAQQALFVPTKGRTINESQRRLTPRYIQEKIQKYRDKLKINIPITPHALRHGFATYLAEEGASPVAIQMLLGHESLNTTTRYVNASDRFAQEAHRKFHPLADSDKAGIKS